jgi:RTX calcium-binding nonapeptide repeat (4 copies)
MDYVREGRPDMRLRHGAGAWLGERLPARVTGEARLAADAAAGRRPPGVEVGRGIRSYLPTGLAHLPANAQHAAGSVRIGGRTLPHGEERTPQREVGKMRRLVLFVVLVTCAAFTLPQIASAAVPRCFGKKATIVGTAKADLIKGTARADVIVGLGGTDTIKGLGGNDLICGGKGADKLIGGGGGDLLSGDAGNDILSGSGAADFLFGGAGNDTFNGGTGFDLARYFFAPSGVQADLTAGTATGGEGSDSLTGIEDLEGSRFDDTLTGDAGENFFYPGAGNDTVVGGGGTTDRVDFFFSPNAVIVDLAAGTATGEGTDTLTGIAQVFGSRHDDTITGDANANALFGGPGNDTISGADGDDTLDGGDGTDTLEGGIGTDTCTNGETVTNCEA